MNTTACGYPFPQCDPPLVKDASDIEQMRDLALAIDADATVQEAKLVEFYEKPDSARMTGSSAVATTGAANGTTLVIPYDTVTHDNTAGSTDLVNDALVPLERGWYLVTSMVRCTNGGSQNLGIRHLRNSLATEEKRRFEGPSLAIGTEEAMTTMDVMFCEAGDRIQTQAKVEGVAGSFTFTSALSMVQLHKLDV